MRTPGVNSGPAFIRGRRLIEEIRYVVIAITTPSPPQCKHWRTARVSELISATWRTSTCLDLAAPASILPSSSCSRHFVMQGKLLYCYLSVYILALKLEDGTESILNIIAVPMESLVGLSTFCCSAPRTPLTPVKATKTPESAYTGACILIPFIIMSTIDDFYYIQTYKLTFKDLSTAKWLTPK